MELIRYAAAACQTDLSNPADRSAMRANTDRMVDMIDAAVAGSRPFLPVKVYRCENQKMPYPFDYRRK